MSSPNPQQTSQAQPKLPKPVRGDVFKARLDPTEGSEQAGSRPVIVISRDAINSSSPVVVIIPTTDAFNPKKIYPSHVFLPKGSGGLRMDSVAKAEQIRSIETMRFMEYWGRLTQDQIMRIEIAIKHTLFLK